MHEQAPTYHKGVVATLMALGTATMGMLAVLHLTGQMPTGTSWLLAVTAAINGSVMAFVWSKRDTLFPTQKASASPTQSSLHNDGKDQDTGGTAVTVGHLAATVAGGLIIFGALFVTARYVQMARFVDQVFATAPGVDGVSTVVDAQEGIFFPFSGTLGTGVFCADNAAPQALFTQRDGSIVLRTMPSEAMAQAEAICKGA